MKKKFLQILTVVGAGLVGADNIANTGVVSDNTSSKILLATTLISSVLPPLVRTLTKKEKEEKELRDGYSAN